ncbi:phosphotransferase [Streptomyces puniciscabiei]
MAAGRSTVARLPAEALPRAAQLRGDVFRRTVVTGRRKYTPGADEEALARLRLRYRLSATATATATATADAYAEAGCTAVVQDVRSASALGENLRACVGLVRTRPLRVVVLAPDAEAVAARESGRAKTGCGASRTVAGLDEEPRHRTPRTGLWPATSAWTPEQTVQELLAHAQRPRVA